MRGRSTYGPMLAAVLVTALVGCGAGTGDTGASAPASSVPASISVTSKAFGAGESIPSQYTCDGAGRIPPIIWSETPAGTEAFAVLVDDPDAPGGTYTHWIVLDLPRGSRSLTGGSVPGGAHQAENSAGSTGWTPPCPPAGGGAHHYRFTVYALRSSTSVEAGASVADARDAIDRLAIARGRLVGTYARSG